MLSLIMVLGAQGSKSIPLGGGSSDPTAYVRHMRERHHSPAPETTDQLPDFDLGDERTCVEALST